MYEEIDRGLDDLDDMIDSFESELDSVFGSRKKVKQPKEESNEVESEEEY